MITLFITPTSPENPGKRKFDCRIEEEPTLAKFLIDSLEHDLADFSNEYPEMDADYLSDFRKKRGQVLELLHPKKITTDLKRVTKRMEKNMRAIRPHLNKLEISARLADKNEELTMDYKDFGIAEVRAAISNKDAERFDGAMGLIKQNITQQYSALTAHGYTDAKRDALYNVWDKVNEDNARQNLLLDERDELAEANINVFNELWDIMTEVCAAGKSIYSFTSPSKTDEYTIEQLKNRIRQQEPKLRYRTITLKPGEVRLLHNVISGSGASNKGSTVIALWDKNVPQPPDAPELEPDSSFPIPLAWSDTISVRNLSSTEKGKLSVLAIGSVE